MIASLSPAAVAALFVVAAGVVWFAGVRLAGSTEILSQQFGLGQALGGAILLAIATNLPELAITASAAASGNLDVAVANILGGIAIQTVVLVLLDRARGKGRPPLMARAATPALILEGLLVIAVLVVTIMAAQFPASLVGWRLTPGVVAIAAVWIAGVWLVGRAARSREAASAPTPPVRRDPQRLWVTLLVFLAAAAATLVGGVVLERAGDSLAGHIGMSGALFGATVLAAATALPEISTGLQSIRDGDDELAVSDIFGGNAFLPVLFLVATLVSGQAVLPGAHRSDIYLACLGALLTCIYLVALVRRPTRRAIGVGVDSVAVLVIYAVGIAGLALIHS